MPVHGAAEHELRRSFAVTIWREVARIHTGRDRRSAHSGSERFQPTSVVLGHRNGEIRQGARLGLTGSKLAPFDLNQCAAPQLRFHSAEPLPDHVLDVVLEDLKAKEEGDGGSDQ